MIYNDINDIIDGIKTIQNWCPLQELANDVGIQSRENASLHPILAERKCSQLTGLEDCFVLLWSAVLGTLDIVFWRSFMELFRKDAFSIFFWLEGYAV